MTATLYQFPISHFCEKARWALDYKGVPFQPHNLLPGLHMNTARRLASNTSVPILDHDGTVVQGSAAIISHPRCGMNPRRMSFPSWRRIGMFWRLGSLEDNRPVAATV